MQVIENHVKRLNNIEAGCRERGFERYRPRRISFPYLGQVPQDAGLVPRVGRGVEEPDDLLPGRADLGAGGLGLRVQSEEDVFQDVEETLVEELGDDVIR